MFSLTRRLESEGRWIVLFFFFFSRWFMGCHLNINVLHNDGLKIPEPFRALVCLGVEALRCYKGLHKVVPEAWKPRLQVNIPDHPNKQIWSRRHTFSPWRPHAKPDCSLLALNPICNSGHLLICTPKETILQREPYSKGNHTLKETILFWMQLNYSRPSPHFPCSILKVLLVTIQLSVQEKEHCK